MLGRSGRCFSSSNDDEVGGLPGAISRERAQRAEQSNTRRSHDHELSVQGRSTRSLTGTSTSSSGPRGSSIRWWSRSGTNISKNALFTPNERVEMLTEECAQWSNVEVLITCSDGLLVDFCAANDIDLISKGLRGRRFQITSCRWRR